MPDDFRPPTQLTADSFAARMRAASAPQSIAIAVSGGRDSIALARLCAAWAKEAGAEVLALTVDHGLRPEAKHEAEQTKHWCEAVGIAHRTLVWEGDKPASRLQAAAREARYRLLIEAAQAHQCGALLTAHTLDDQAETFFMRLSRGAGQRGLSAMREESLVASGAGEPLRLLRPLLDAGRDDVTAYLEGLGQEFVDDPSNLDDRYERVRVRALLAALSEQELISSQALAASAQKLARADDAVRRSEDLLFDRFGGCFYAWGGASLDRWDKNAPSAAGLARRLLHGVGGGDYAPEEAAAADVFGAPGEGAATLAGALIRRWGGRLWVMREPAALLGRAGVPAKALIHTKTPILWDRRFIVTPELPDGVEIAPLGMADNADFSAQNGLFPGPPEGLAAAPGLYQRGVLIASPALPSKGAETANFRSLVIERFQGGVVRFP
ncbi:tRNA lysidine(34) synthetase TilS [Hyphococcus sp.]|uniref:tRNA lysidine(34) synthetase TilS n=1 Tax=Hyphococcus sp. TaxID=2038636 RepID=UPI002084FD76|nr:MAG: tRNA(Ile)-lysidine synthase [Marinicaulis sp.]